VCEHVFVSIKGGAYPRFRRALEAGNALIVRAAAAELTPPLSLADALAVTLVLHDDERFDRAAARWTARLSLETASVSLADAQLAAAALRLIAGARREAGVDALAALLGRLSLAECTRELRAWQARQR
jgi:hypothetical protein